MDQLQLLDIQNELDDVKEKIPEGLYLKLCSALKDKYDDNREQMRRRLNEMEEENANLSREYGQLLRRFVELQAQTEQRLSLAVTTHFRQFRLWRLIEWFG